MASEQAVAEAKNLLLLLAPERQAMTPDEAVAYVLRED